MTNAELITELTYHASIEKRKLLSDAADALEAAEKRIAELESNNPIVESVLVDKLNQRIAELEEQKEPVLNIWVAHGIRDKNVPFGYDCSRCGKWVIIRAQEADEYHYCPNCGARMEGRKESAE